MYLKISFGPWGGGTDACGGTPLEPPLLFFNETRALYFKFISEEILQSLIQDNQGKRTDNKNNIVCHISIFI